MSDLSFEDFQKTVAGAHTVKLWEVRLNETLSYATLHPEDRWRIGLIPCDSGGFLVNATVSGRFFRLNRLSVNRNLRDHRFRQDNYCNIAAELRAKCPALEREERKWRKWIPTMAPADHDAGSIDGNSLSWCDCLEGDNAFFDLVDN